MSHHRLTAPKAAISARSYVEFHIGGPSGWEFLFLIKKRNAEEASNAVKRDQNPEISPSRGF